MNDATSQTPHAPKGQPQSSLGHSDRRERRPRFAIPIPPPSPERAKQTAVVRPCTALSGLEPLSPLKPRAALRGSRRYALPWAGMSLPLRGVSEVATQSPVGRFASTETMTPLNHPQCQTPRRGNHKPAWGTATEGSAAPGLRSNNHQALKGRHITVEGNRATPFRKAYKTCHPT